MPRNLIRLAGARRRLRYAVAVLLLTPLLGLAPPAQAATGLTERSCADFITGDYVRKLSVCSRGWDSPSTTRGVIEMHTYAFVTGAGYWVDSRSQSITVNYAVLSGSNGYTEWGTRQGATCRVDSPAGRVACSVPNVTRVAFYSPASRTITNENEVCIVSWRDDRGVAHTVSWESYSYPDRLPLYSPLW